MHSVFVRLLHLFSLHLTSFCEGTGTWAMNWSKPSFVFCFLLLDSSPSSNCSGDNNNNDDDVPTTLLISYDFHTNKKVYESWSIIMHTYSIHTCSSTAYMFSSSMGVVSEADASPLNAASFFALHSATFRIIAAITTSVNPEHNNSWHRITSRRPTIRNSSSLLLPLLSFRAKTCILPRLVPADVFFSE